MPGPLIVILGAAAEAYAKQLALSVGQGLVETLFHQERIQQDLEDIKRQLTALSNFVMNELPGLMRASVDQALAHAKEIAVVDQIVLVRGRMATLKKEVELAVPARVRHQERIAGYTRDLAQAADDLWISGGALISYGPPYYASVGVAFHAAFEAYIQVVDIEPSRFEALHAVTASWRGRLLPWVDGSVAAQGSFTKVLSWWVQRHDLGARVFPTFDTATTHTTREVVLAWDKLPPQQGDYVALYGAWYGWTSGKLDGNYKTRFLPAGMTYDQGVATDAIRPMTVPEWGIAVKPNSAASRADYEAAAASLHALIDDYLRFPSLQPGLQSAVDVVNAMIVTIDAVHQSDASRSLDSAASSAATNVAPHGTAP